MLVSVITPTIRKDGLEIVRKSLKKQTFKDFEWLIGSPFNPKIKEAKWVKDDFSGGFWSLNRIYNKLFRKTKGEIIVTLQDWIYIPSDGVEKFVIAVEKTNGIVSGVGDQYERLNKYGKPEVKIWSDPRKRIDIESFYEIYPNDAEWNWCAFPKKAIFDIGGCDEKLDTLGYGGDQLQVVERMDAIGYKFYIDQSNESMTLRHDRSDFGGQKEWDKNHVLFNGQYKKRKEELIKSGKWPKLDYLS